MAHFRVKQVAERLQVTEQRVLTWIRANKLRAIDVSEGAKGHRWRISPESLEAFELSRMPVQTVKPSRRRAGKYEFQYF